MKSKAYFIFYWKTSWIAFSSCFVFYLIPNFIICFMKMSHHHFYFVVLLQSCTKKIFFYLFFSLVIVRKIKKLSNNYRPINKDNINMKVQQLLPISLQSGDTLLPALQISKKKTKKIKKTTNKSIRVSSTIDAYVRIFLWLYLFRA